MDNYAINCQSTASKRYGPTALMMSMACMMVAQKLRFLEDLGFNLYYIETLYLLPIEAVCIFCTIVEQPITVSRFLR
jgi:hypothetical protein